MSTRNELDEKRECDEAYDDYYDAAKKDGEPVIQGKNGGCIYRHDIDPRGPLVKSTAVAARTDGVTVTYSCGHSGEHAQHFSHRVGDDYRCFKCGRAALAKANT